MTILAIYDANIHPSLQRQAILNMAYGLYEVLPGRNYQVRGYDLANISFIKSDTGWIVFDPLTAKETAAAALKFINGQLGTRPVVAVVYSHSHGDHFGGVRGVVDETDVRSGKVKVIAPAGFMQHAIFYSRALPGVEWSIFSVAERLRPPIWRRHRCGRRITHFL